VSELLGWPRCFARCTSLSCSLAELSSAVEEAVAISGCKTVKCTPGAPGQHANRPTVQDCAVPGCMGLFVSARASHYVSMMHSLAFASVLIHCKADCMSWMWYAVTLVTAVGCFCSGGEGNHTWEQSINGIRATAMLQL